MKRIGIGVGLLVVACVCMSVIHFVRNDELNQAAKVGDISRVRRFIEAGVSVNGQGMHGMTPVMSACRSGNADVVRLLIANGGDVNGHNSSGSALMWAIESGNVDVVKLLLENDVDVDWRNALGKDALEFARAKSDKPMVELLNEHQKRRVIRKDL